jgi:hypothetical protein
MAGKHAVAPLKHAVFLAKEMVLLTLNPEVCKYFIEKKALILRNFYPASSATTRLR